MQRSLSVASTMVGSIMSKDDDKMFDENNSDKSVESNIATDSFFVAAQKDHSSVVAPRQTFERRDSDTHSIASTLVSIERNLPEGAPSGTLLHGHSATTTEHNSRSFANFEFPPRERVTEGTHIPSPLVPPPLHLTIYTPASSSPVWPGLHPHASERDDVPRTARPFSLG